MTTRLTPTRLALAVAALLLPLTATANQSLNSAGYSATIGGVINEGSVHSSSFNPAGNNLLLHKDDKFRFGYLSNLGAYVEIGEADDLDVKVDALVDDLSDIDNFSNAAARARLEARYGLLAGGEAAYYEAIANKANTEIITDLEQGGQFRTGAQLQLPLTPFLFRSTLASGTFSLNASASAQVKGAFLGGEFGVNTHFKNGNTELGSFDINLEKAAGAYQAIEAELEAAGNNLSAANIANIESILKTSGALPAKGNNEATIAALQQEISNNGTFKPTVNTTLTTDSGLDVKAAVVAHLALGYGTNLSEAFELDRTHGQLEMGTRLNFYSVETGRKFVSIQAEADNNNGSKTSDSLTEDFLDNTEKSVGFGLDVGFLWHSNNYQAGITFYNLNEPSFDYPDLNAYINDNATKSAINGLQAAGKIKAVDSVTLTRHAVVEAAYYTNSRNWMLQGAYTLGTATNFVGDEFQNLHLAAGYFPKTAWLPGVRLGYSQNMKGSELSKIHAGATFFGIMHLDVALSPDTSTFDGTEVPRYAAISLGFEEKF